MGGQSNVYVQNIDGLSLFTTFVHWGGWVVKKGQNAVYVVIEWPLMVCIEIIRCQAKQAASKVITFCMFVSVSFLRLRQQGSDF